MAPQLQRPFWPKWAVAAAVLAAWLLANPNGMNPAAPRPRGGAPAVTRSSPGLPAPTEAPLPVHSHALNTYYIHASGARLTAPAAGSPSSDSAVAAVLELQLPLDVVSKFMPIVSATPQGLVHQLADTANFLRVGARLLSLFCQLCKFRPTCRLTCRLTVAAVALQDWALLDEAVQALVYCRADGDAAGPPLRLFASPGALVQAASALTPRSAGIDTATGDNDDLAVAARALDCASWRASGLARTSPASTLMLLPGQPFAAVADVLAVSLLPAQQPSSAHVAALTLALVAAPRMVSELDGHPEQDLGSQRHYHFSTPPGVVVDARRFIETLQQQDMAPAGADHKHACLQFR